MKTYNSSSSTTKKNVITIVTVLSLSALVIGLSIFFAVTSSKNEQINTPTGEVVDVVKPIETYSVPVNSYTIAKEASIDKLVYMSSLNMWKTHNGVDFAVSEGATVSAVFSGTVKSVEQSTLEGVTVTVEQANGMTAIYKSLSDSAVKVGDKVENGSLIGSAGTMLSENDMGVHLHLELKKDGKYVNPLEYIDVSGSVK